ncbi:MAG TPA: hypothetical protein VN625_10040, partial [Desulfuromonadaceae bacterium]|nr:hypothetical protein [Desulfuromonadaceae bacterium]
MEIKIQCGCGTKYKFDVEPVNGRMPVAAICPGCGNNGTFEANQQISQRLGTTATFAPPAPAPAVTPSSGGLRISGAGQAVTTFVAGHAPSGDVSQEEGKALLHRTTFFVKERAGILKLTDTYDILDPANGQPIGIAKEEPPVWAKYLRLVIKKHQMPTAINVYETEGQPPVLSVKRGFTLLRSKIDVISGGKSLGYFKSKMFSIGGGFYVYDQQGQQVAEVKGNWKGWDFKFLNKGGQEIGSVTKK